VPLEELLDEREDTPGSAGDDQVEQAAPDIPAAAVDGSLRAFTARNKKGLGIAGGLAFLALITIFLVLQFRPGLTAVRIFPNHTAPNLPFPVMIRIKGEVDSKNTLLVREELAGDCEAIGSAADGPPKEFGKNPRWIGKLIDGKAAFLYLVQPGKKLRTDDEIRFSGDIISREGQTAGDAIGGPEHIVLAPYHWVDSDKDYVISDSEILKAYETYSMPGENLINFTAIEELWLAGKYAWNKKTMSFVPSNLADSKE
jgi:hypothetical protein